MGEQAEDDEGLGWNHCAGRVFASKRTAHTYDEFYISLSLSLYIDFKENMCAHKQQNESNKWQTRKRERERQNANDCQCRTNTFVRGRSSRRLNRRGKEEKPKVLLCVCAYVFFFSFDKLLRFFIVEEDMLSEGWTSARRKERHACFAFRVRPGTFSLFLFSFSFVHLVHTHVSGIYIYLHIRPSLFLSFVRFFQRHFSADVRVKSKARLFSVTPTMMSQ